MYRVEKQAQIHHRRHLRIVHHQAAEIVVAGELYEIGQGRIHRRMMSVNYPPLGLVKGFVHLVKALAGLLDPGTWQELM
jgi:hypothetical protein